MWCMSDVVTNVFSSSCSRAAFPKLWVATRRWVADFIQVGRRGLKQIIIFIVYNYTLHLDDIQIVSGIKH